MMYVTLSNGVKMPQLGYGVYEVTKEECERCVRMLCKGTVPAPLIRLKVILMKKKSEVRLKNPAYQEKKFS